MAENFNHSYTQLLIICLLSYEFRERPWWILLIAIVISTTLAFIIAVIREHYK